MPLQYLFLLALGVLASPIDFNETSHQQNEVKLLNALANFGKENFTWPELALPPAYHAGLMVDDIGASEDEEDISTADVAAEDIELENMDLEAPQEAFITLEAKMDEVEMDGDFTYIIPEDHPVLNIPPEPAIHYTRVTDKPIYVFHHPENDDPSDPEKDAYHYTEAHISRPICSYFQHSVLGVDFGESTFPRVSYVSSDALPFRVHYAPDDNLRFESYKWPFAACNHACELQALRIRALFDWELDPVNEDTRLDYETKQALKVAREICQWKNVHHHFAVGDCPENNLRKQYFSAPWQPADLQNSLAAHTPGTAFVLEKQPKSDELTRRTSSSTSEQANTQKVTGTELYLSDRAREAIREIERIFLLTKGPKDLAQMFHTVIIACQIHRYTSAPMVELEISSTQQMVRQAMSQIERLFGETQGRIDVMETRDAVIRATQIYRYQEEQDR